MPITLLTGPANAGKARVLLDGVRRDISRGAEPLLIVPTREDVEHYRRELAAESVALGVMVGRFDELLDEVIARAGGGAEPLGRFARQRALEVIAARRARGRTASPGYARELAALVDELRECRVSGRRLRRAIEESALGRQALRAAEEVEEYEALLERLGRADAAGRASTALDVLRRSPWLWGASPVHLYGFDDLTRIELDAIRTLGTVVDADLTVSQTFEPGRSAFASRAATFYELAPAAREHRALAGRSEHYAPAARAALSHLERSLFEPDAGSARECEGVRLLRGADEREELELVAEEISCLLRAGIAPEEIAVGIRSPEGAADLIEEVFTNAGIPFVLERERRFSDTATGSALIGLLRSVGGAGDAAGRDGAQSDDANGLANGDAANGAVTDLLAWLRTPGLLTRPELADRLEARARRDGVRSAARARALWERDNWPLDAIGRLTDAQSKPHALIARAQHELERAFAAARARSARVLDAEEMDEARALGAGRAALEELLELVRHAPELAPRGAADLAGSLDSLRFRGGAHAAIPGATSAGAVAVVDPLGIRARRVRVLFLCRMQVGSFPALTRRAPLLGEEERSRLAQLGGLRLGDPRDALADERYLLYAAISRPEESLVLSWHAAAEDGAPRAKSQFVDEVCDVFDGAPARLEAQPPPYALVDSAATSLAQLPPLPALHERHSHTRPPNAAVAGEPSISAAELLPDGEEHVWSASSLGVWMSCPVRWFVERVLRADDLDPLGEPLSRGLLAHAVLKDTLDALRIQTGSARVTRANLDQARTHLADALSERAAELPLSAERERALALDRRLRADLERYLEHSAAAADAADADAADTAGALEPRHLELEFGLAEDALPPLDLGGGLKLRGRIDRVDVNEAGDAVVFDYKGRIATPAAKWVDAGEVQVALYMRAVEELLELHPAGGFYQPLSGDLRARGVLDADSGVALPVVSTDRRDASEVRELLEQAVAAARDAARQAARGALEPRPRTCTPRGGCAYPTICRCSW